MVHVPQILKVSAKALKPVVITGIALVQANPVAAAFTVVAVVGVGLAIYYTKHSKNKKREDDLSYLSHENKGYFRDTSNYFYDPESKSIATDVSKSTASYEKETLRKRQNDQSGSSTNENNPPRAEDDRKSNLTFLKEEDAEICGNNLSLDKGKDLSNDIPNTAKALTREENVNKFLKNLPENKFTVSTDRHDNESQATEIIEKNSIDDLSIGSNSQSYWIDNSFLDLNDIRSESSVGTLLPEKSDWCRACRNKPVNTHTEPCNHRYMCEDCAPRIFRLFKRCKVCRRRIDEIIVETS